MQIEKLNQITFTTEIHFIKLNETLLNIVRTKCIVSFLKQNAIRSVIFKNPLV